MTSLIPALVVTALLACAGTAAAVGSLNGSTQVAIGVTLDAPDPASDPASGRIALEAEARVDAPEGLGGAEARLGAAVSVQTGSQAEPPAQAEPDASDADPPATSTGFVARASVEDGAGAEAGAEATPETAPGFWIWLRLRIEAMLEAMARLASWPSASAPASEGVAVRLGAQAEAEVAGPVDPALPAGEGDLAAIPVRLDATAGFAVDVRTGPLG